MDGRNTREVPKYVRIDRTKRSVFEAFLAGSCRMRLVMERLAVGGLDESRF